MALVNCEVCGNQVSTTKTVCPKCGAVRAKSMPVAEWVLIVAFSIGILVWLAKLIVTEPLPGAARSLQLAIFSLVPKFPEPLKQLLPTAMARGRPPLEHVTAPGPPDPPRLNCDSAAAHVIMANLRNTAQITESGEVVRYEWGSVLGQEPDGRRLTLVRTAADADACLTGRAREMRHFVNGRYIAIASPTSGVRLMY